MKVNFVDLKAQYESIKNDIDAAIAEVVSNTAFVGGKYVNAFNESFAEFTGAKHCLGVGNGTDAIFIAMKALGIGPGDEVIVPANTFFATAEGVAEAGAQPVFVDCNPDTCNIDASKIGAAITDKTKAVMAVHLYGRPADMDAIKDAVAGRDIKIVEDAAQAHGAVYKGRNIGAIGDMACFSFYPGKNLGAYGDGGAVTTNDEELAKKARMFANHGRLDKYNHLFEGVNSRLDGIQAAVLSAKLPHLDSWNARRIEIAAKYDAALAGSPAKSLLPEEGNKHVYHLYVIRVQDREAVMAALKEKEIFTGVHYPIALPFLKAYEHLGHKPEDFPVAYKYQSEIMSLPIHGSMTDAEVDYVIENLLEILK